MLKTESQTAGALRAKENDDAGETMALCHLYEAFQHRLWMSEVRKWLCDFTRASLTWSNSTYTPLKLAESRVVSMGCDKRGGLSYESELE